MKLLRYMNIIIIIIIITLLHLNHSRHSIRRKKFLNLNVPPKSCADLHTFSLSLDYSESLFSALRFVAILSASRRSCRLVLRRVVCSVRIEQYKQFRRPVSSSVMIF